MTTVFTAAASRSSLLACRTLTKNPTTALFQRHLLQRRKPTFVSSGQRSSTTSAYREATTRSSSSSGSSTGAGGDGNPFKRAFFWYADKLESHPIITKGLTAGFIGAMGDVLCQVFIDKPEKEYKKIEAGEFIEDEAALWWFEPGRTTRFFVLGVGLVGPWCHAWFGTLARWLPKTTPTSILTRVALDQFAFTPIILSTFISSLWTLERVMGDDAHSDVALSKLIPDRLQTTLPDCIVANWILWFPCQLVNFRLVPQKYQVLFANMVSLVWNAYLSFSTRAAEPLDEEVEEKILESAPMAVTLVHRMSTRVHNRAVENTKLE